MKNFLVTGFLILISLKSFGQADAPPVAAEAGSDVVATDPSKFEKPKSRLRPKNQQPPQDSSSFMGDADNLDPLNANKDNLKEDDEPVLEDIKDVLNASAKKKDLPPPPTSAPGADSPVPTPVDSALTATPAPETAQTAEPPKAAPEPKFMPDDPDLALEKKFHNIYQVYNKNPTPDDIWAQASGKQTARLYEVQKGDTLWSISKVLFGDPNFWPKLWAINKQGILNPHFINPKMKIYFFEGTEENAPTLTVGENPPPVEETKPEAVTPVVEESKSALAPGTPVVAPPKLAAGAQVIEAVVKVDRNKYKPLNRIPPSLPEGRNTEYFYGKDRKVGTIKVDLGVEPKSEFYYVNDIILTDVDVKTDVQIKLEEIQKLRCSPGRLLKEIEHEGSFVEQYDIYEKLEGIKTSTGYKYAYRLTGKAKPYKDKYLSVIECNSFIGTDLVIVPKDQMKELATQKVSDVEEAHLIGAPDLFEQKYYAVMQYAYVDFGAQKYDVGQNYKLISDITDQVNGEFRVVEKFGSYAVVVMTDVQDQISINDKVEIQQ